MPRYFVYEPTPVFFCTESDNKMHSLYHISASTYCSQAILHELKLVIKIMLKMCPLNGKV